MHAQNEGYSISNAIQSSFISSVASQLLFWNTGTNGSFYGAGEMKLIAKLIGQNVYRNHKNIFNSVYSTLIFGV